eukprot:TRINITY_DN114590_c0_g1_i1.p1 TRINITY_DN114590_c0_g1~~TRINITY_DN114590_c0_g1_i1.p1  ORF type:complete len:127 (-),score=15.62 TRINITY_DN114590_c0_g1_i1:1-381(-)
MCQAEAKQIRELSQEEDGDNENSLLALPTRFEGATVALLKLLSSPTDIWSSGMLKTLEVLTYFVVQGLERRYSLISLSRVAEGSHKKVNASKARKPDGGPLRRVPRTDSMSSLHSEHARDQMTKRT